jgi:transposase
MIDADAPQGAPRRDEPASKGAAPRCIGRDERRLSSKLHAACDGQGHPILLLLTAGQMSDHKDAAILLPALPPARSRKAELPHDKTLYRQRHRIDNTFGRLKDWRCRNPLRSRHTHPFSRPSASNIPSHLGTGSES